MAALWCVRHDVPVRGLDKIAVAFVLGVALIFREVAASPFAPELLLAVYVLLVGPRSPRHRGRRQRLGHCRRRSCRSGSSLVIVTLREVIDSYKICRAAAVRSRPGCNLH